MSVIPEEVIAKAWKSDDEDTMLRTFKIAGVWEKGVFDIPKDGDEGGEDYDEWQVEKAYKKLSKKHHPDKKKGGDEEDIALDIFYTQSGKEEILERFETKEERFKMAVNIRDIIVDDVDKGWLVFEHTYEEGGESSTDVKGFKSKAKAEEYVKDEMNKLKAGGWNTAFHKLKKLKEKKVEKKKVAKVDEDPDPDDWSDIEDAMEDNLPEGYDIDDTGTLTGDDGIPWKEDGMYNLYMQDEDGDWDYEWILPKDTPKGLKVPKFPKKVQKFFEGAVYQNWKKNRQKQGGGVHEVDPYLGAPEMKKSKPKKPTYKKTEAGKLSAKEKAEVKAYIQAMKNQDVGLKQGKFKW